MASLPGLLLVNLDDWWIHKDENENEVIVFNDYIFVVVPRIENGVPGGKNNGLWKSVMKNNVIS